MKKKVIIIAVYLFTACAGISDFIDDLGGNFYYKGEGKGLNLIFYGKEYKGGYLIDKAIIFPSVIDYEYNKKYILVKQNPDIDGIKYGLISFDERYSYLFESKDQNSIDEQNKFLAIADSIVKNDKEYRRIFKNKFNYYIINKVNKTRYGPFSKVEFENKLEEFNISIKLE